MRKEIKANAYIIKYFCDECNVEVEPTTKCNLSNPPQYEYVCPKCSKKYYLKEVYPHIIHKEKIKLNQSRKG